MKLERKDICAKPILGDLTGGQVFVVSGDEVYIRCHGGDGSLTNSPTAIRARDGVCLYLNLQSAITLRPNSVLTVA